MPIDLTRKPPRPARGFTLLELLVVIAILTAVAFVASGTFRGVQTQADDAHVRVEMQEIAKALRQFKADTGYYPKTGPFALAADGGKVDYDVLPETAGANDAARKRWFYSPANFDQLLTRTSPLDGTGHQLEKWNPETGRGWRGPYLQGFSDGLVSVGNDINDTGNTAAGNETGHPAEGDIIGNIPGIADPFEHKRSGNYLVWSLDSDKWGRPYLLFNLDGLNGSPLLRSLGPDGDCGTAKSDADNIELEID